jgi:glutathione synthase/RimK-type ligase-like ATP-grasp enzyme
VEKSEINAAHDGRIVQCPTNRVAGRVYQRVVDNRMPGNLDLVEDLRTCTVGGKPACVFIKRRQVTKRFLNTNTEVLLRTPDEVFSNAELEQISAFTREIGLDWGGVDVLRDRNDGKLYIVDANKTDMGPPIGLNLQEKIRAAYMLRDAFRNYVCGA